MGSGDEIMLILCIELVVYLLLYVIFSLYTKSSSVIEIIKYIERKISLILPKNLSNRAQELLSTCITIVILISILLCNFLIVYMLNTKGIEENNIVHEIYEEKILDTTASFKVYAEQENNVKWELYQIYTGNDPKRVTSGKGTQITLKDLMPTTNYKIVCFGKVKKEKAFTTKQSAYAQSVYLDVIINSFSNGENISVEFVNDGSGRINEVYTYKITDKDGNFVLKGKKRISMFGGTKKTISLPNSKNGLYVELYNSRGEFVKGN